jgi:hypothetical protein
MSDRRKNLVKKLKMKSFDILLVSVTLNKMDELNYRKFDVQLVAKKTGNENFPNVNLVLSICQLIVNLTIPIK